MKRKPEYTTVCPECGLRLIFEDGVCFCPGEYCSYKCDACKRGEDFVLSDKEA